MVKSSGGFTVGAGKVILRVEYSILASHNLLKALRMNCSVLREVGQTASGSHASSSSTL
jgi:hypothetical protein